MASHTHVRQKLSVLLLRNNKILPAQLLGQAVLRKASEMSHAGLSPLEGSTHQPGCVPLT